MKFKSFFGAIAAAAMAALSIVTTSVPANADTANCGSALKVTAIHSSTFYIDTAVGFDANYVGYALKNVSGSSVSGVTLDLAFSGSGTVGLATGESGSRTIGSIAAGATKYVYFLAKSTATGDSDVVNVMTASVAASSPSTTCSNVGDMAHVRDVLKTSASTISTVTLSTSDTTVAKGSLLTVIVKGKSGTIGAGTTADPKLIQLSPVTTSANFDPAYYRLVSAKYAATSGTCTLNDLIRNINVTSGCNGDYVATYIFETIASSSQTVASKIDGQSYIASGTQIKHPDVKTAVTLPLVLNARGVSYNGNGGTGSVSGDIDSDPIAIKANGYTYACHTFMGWNTEPNGSGDAYAAADSYTGTDSITLYAQWSLDSGCELAETGSTAPIGFAALAVAMIALGVVLRRRNA